MLKVRLIQVGAPMMREYYRENDHRMTFIYAIQAGGEDGPVKIGVTRKPWERLQTLQQANHLELRGIASWRDLPQEEKRLHQEFAYARIRGEWFEPVPELLEYVLWHGGIFCDWEKPEGERRS